MNPTTISPKAAMLLSGSVFIAMGFLAYYWLTAPILTLSEVTQFTGTVKEAKEYRGKKTTLEIILSEHPLPFRCFSSIYPDGFDKTLLSQLRPGAPVSLGVATSEVALPRHNLVQNQKYYAFITMTLDGHLVLPLDAHNKSTERSRKFGPWFCAMMGLGCIWLFSVGYRHRNSSQPLTKLVTKKL